MKKHLKLSLFSLALVLVVSGCSQKIKPEEKNNTQLPEKIVSTTTQEVKKPDALNRDIVVSESGGEKIITHNKYKFSLKVSDDSTVTEDYLPVGEAREAFRVGDIGVIIATGTIENLNKGFFEEESLVADSDILKKEKVVVASGQIGQAYFYDYNTSSYSAHSYSFLIPINEGKNILILKMGYNGDSIRKDFFKNVISAVSVN